MKFEMTDRAGEKLKATLEERNADPDVCVRLETTLSRGGTLRVDKVKPGDTTFQFDDRKVLALDRDAADKYSDRRLDFQKGQFCFG